LLVCQAEVHFYGFVPEYPDQFENLTIPELKQIIGGDVRAVKSMMSKASLQYQDNNLTPAANFYTKVTDFIDDNLSGALNYIDHMKNVTIRHRTYVQFAQHSRKCRDVGADEAVKRFGHQMNVSDSEEQLKSEFTQIYNKAISLMKSAVQFELKYDIAFWPTFHSTVSKTRHGQGMNI
jgi:hypothetical protein